MHERMNERVNAEGEICFRLKRFEFDVARSLALDYETSCTRRYFHYRGQVS